MKPILILAVRLRGFEASRPHRQVIFLDKPLFLICCLLFKNKHNHSTWVLVKDEHSKNETLKLFQCLNYVDLKEYVVKLVGKNLYQELCTGVKKYEKNNPRSV